jgi:hypothetical protein
MPPLSSIFSEKVNINFPRIVFILTDGGVDNREGTVDLVKRNAEYCNVHVLGISSGVDRTLVENVAKAGNGNLSLY